MDLTTVVPSICQTGNLLSDVLIWGADYEHYEQNLRKFDFQGSN